MIRFLLLVAFGLSCASVLAQTNWSLELEAHAGLSGQNYYEGAIGNATNTVLFSDDWEEGYYLSRGAGLVVGYQLHHSLELRMQATFRQLGVVASLTQQEYDLESLRRTTQTTDFHLAQQQISPAISARFYLTERESRVRPFVSIGGQAVRLLRYRLESKTAGEQHYQDNPEILVQEEVIAEIETERSSAWRLGWFTAFGVKWGRFSLHLQYDWDTYPQLRLFPTTDVGYLTDCYSCRLAERASTPQLQQATVRFGYRFF